MITSQRFAAFAAFALLLSSLSAVSALNPPATVSTGIANGNDLTFTTPLTLVVSSYVNTAVAGQPVFLTGTGFTRVNSVTLVGGLGSSHTPVSFTVQSDNSLSFTTSQAFPGNLYLILRNDIGEVVVASTTTFTAVTTAVTAGGGAKYLVKAGGVLQQNGAGGITSFVESGGVVNGGGGAGSLTYFVKSGGALNLSTASGGGLLGFFEPGAIFTNSSGSGGSFIPVNAITYTQVTLTPPTVTTSPATNLTGTTATLNGSVNPNGQATTAQFQYGLTASYGSTSSVLLSPNNGTGTQNVSASISGLSPGAVYHFRLTASNSGSTINGVDQILTTLSNDASLAGLVLSTGSLSPTCASGTTTYTASVSNVPGLIAITPTLADSTATVQVNGVTVASGSASNPIALSVGGNTINTVVKAQDGTTTRTYKLTVTRESVIETWRQTYFGTPANTGSAANTADPDGDGITNLMEMAFGTNPIVGSGGKIVVSGGVLNQRGLPDTTVQNLARGVDFRAVYGRRKDYVAAGLTYKVQFSGDLITWDNSTAAPAAIADDGTIEAVTVRYPFFVSNGLKATFFRVQVTLAP